MPTSFSFVRSLVPVVALTATALGACSSSPSDDPFGQSEAALRALGPGEILGKLVAGDTKVVDYTPTPRFRAFSFFANRGDEVDVWARSTTGDAMLWLTTADFANVASNDDADVTTSNAHVVQKFTKAGTYFVVVREHFERAAQFTLTFDKRVECDPDERVCDEPPSPLVIPSVASEVASAVQTLSVSRVAPRLPARMTALPCPLAPDPFTMATSTPATYVRVENREATPRRIALWTSHPVGQTQDDPAFIYDTMMAVYDGGAEPRTDAERLACKAGTWLADTCASALPTACASDLAGFVPDDTFGGTGTADHTIVVPANGTITVYLASYFTRTKDATVQLNVRAEP